MNSSPKYFDGSFILVLVILLASFAASAADTVIAAEPPLPDVWNAVWSGEIKVIADGEIRHASTMELRVASIAGRPAKTWSIHYSGQPSRNYEITPATGGKGRFIVDEKNGLLLDEQLVGDTLYSAFSVGNVLLNSRFERRGDEMHVEIATYELASTNAATVSNAQATAYPFRSIQVGILRRQKD
jgi:hypothetical protein